MDFKFKDSMLLRIAISMILTGYTLQSYSATDIVVDASLQTPHNTVTPGNHTLSPSNTIITVDGDQDGKIVNNNLFFSFSKFSIGGGDKLLAKS